MSAGSTRVTLDGVPDAASPFNASAMVVVTSEMMVSVKHLVARLVTSAEWEPNLQPPSSLYAGSFGAAFSARHDMNLEGDTGRVFVAARFSDFHWQRVDASQLTMQLTDSSIEMHPPTADEPF